MFKRREAALKSKDAELQESLIRFSKFLQVRPSEPASAPSAVVDVLRASIVAIVAARERKKRRITRI